MEITRLRSGRLLDAAEERELAYRIEVGVYAAALRSAGGHPRVGEVELTELERLGAEAWDRFLLANLRLVSMVSRATARGTGHQEPDLFQEGCAGLAQALRRFDPRAGVRFATYALPWIRSSVARASERQLGEPDQERRHQARRAWWRLAQQLSREPTAVEVAADLGQDSVRVARALHADHGVVLFDDTTWREPSDEAAQARLAVVLQHRVPVKRWLATLPRLESEVIWLRFGFAGGPHGYAEVGRQLRLQPNRVRRLEARALDRLRELCHTDDLPMAV
ncbi:sigma-70 family RNA polymerase sigma factor [Naumannella sp. ID2617S]|nr:sigma-70 family RNA polymerase sigma factor [Naumannella sp. ID2617S]